MRSPHDVILKPIVTEASMDNMAEKKYTFKVDKKANKTEIKNAIQQIFSVKVAKVNTMNMIGKMKRQGANVGRRAGWKKAIVTLTADSNTIEFFEGM
jgi:large subunit ribosomal protein L23